MAGKLCLGNTLVGLRVIHAHMLDGIAEPRAGRKPVSAAAFLCGNRPLVEVLQCELKGLAAGANRAPSRARMSSGPRPLQYSGSAFGINRFGGRNAEKPQPRRHRI